MTDLWVQSSEEKEEKRQRENSDGDGASGGRDGGGHSREEERAAVLGIMAFIDLGHGRLGYMGWPSCPCFLLCFLVSFPFPP